MVSFETRLGICNLNTLLFQHFGKGNIPIVPFSSQI
jgi:hypothetical protein